MPVRTASASSPCARSAPSLIALCSVGPIAAVLLLSLTASGNLSFAIPDYSMDTILHGGVWHLFGEMALEVVKSLLLVVVFFFILQAAVLKLPRTKIIQILFGIVYTFVGLVLFLAAVSMGFMPVGFKAARSSWSFSPSCWAWSSSSRNRRSTS